MKKLLAICLSLILCITIVSNAFASSDFSVEDYTNPFTGNAYTENSFYGNGTIIIILSHGASIEWREYTEADFPELELESVDTKPPASTDMEFIKGNSEYRNFVHITLKDKSNEAVIEAVNVLYKRSSGGIHLVVPMSKTYYDEPEVSLPLEEGITIGDVNGDLIFNLTDVSLILKHIAKWEKINIIPLAADLNGDGTITLSDASMLLRMIAGWEAR